jgi:hypothetical protein
MMRVISDGGATLAATEMRHFSTLSASLAAERDVHPLHRGNALIALAPADEIVDPAVAFFVVQDGHWSPLARGCYAQPAARKKARACSWAARVARDSERRLATTSFFHAGHCALPPRVRAVADTR